MLLETHFAFFLFFVYFKLTNCYPPLLFSDLNPAISCPLLLLLLLLASFPSLLFLGGRVFMLPMGRRISYIQLYNRLGEGKRRRKRKPPPRVSMPCTLLSFPYVVCSTLITFLYLHQLLPRGLAWCCLRPSSSSSGLCW